MKTQILMTTFVCAASLALAEEKTIGEKTGEVIDKAVEKTKEAGRVVVDKSKEVGRAAMDKSKEAGKVVVDETKKAANAVSDAVAPDKDANRVDVKLVDHRIELPKSVASGKTAFVVTNVGSMKHNFEVEGQGLERKFMLNLSPNETKILHVELKPGTYKLYCPVGDHEEKGMATELHVK